MSRAFESLKWYLENIEGWDWRFVKELREVGSFTDSSGVKYIVAYGVDNKYNKMVWFKEGSRWRAQYLEDWISNFSTREDRKKALVVLMGKDNDI